MKLNSKNTHFLLIGLLVLMIAAFFAAIVVGSSKLTKKSQQMVDLKIKSQTADLQLSNLEQTKKDVEKYAYFKEVAQTVIPADKDQAKTVLAIFQIADDAGLNIQSINFPPSTLGINSSTGAQDATTPSSASKAISQAKPVTTIPGLYSVELDITPSSDKDTPVDQQITYEKMLNFLQGLENNRRTSQVSEIKINPASATQTLSFTLKLNTFIKP